MMSILCGVYALLFIPVVQTIEWVENNGLWYYISDEEMIDYPGAVTKCESMNAHLAVITNHDQNSFIRNAAEDSIGRWIGLSNKPTNHSNIHCASTTWLWNGDWYCTNGFKSEGDLPYPTTSDCVGVTTEFGIWAAHNCSRKFGYICQWECKIFYFDPSYTNGSYSGIYEFDSYFNGHAVYRKRGTTRKIKMYKAVVLQLQAWILHDDDKNLNWIARFSTESYVPYDSVSVWKTFFSQEFTSHTFCIECESYKMCIYSTELLKCYDIFLNVSVLVYSNIEGDVFLKRHHGLQSCICSPSIGECGDRCGNIFPYPNVTTHTTLDDAENVTFTNLCILSEQPVTTTEITILKTYIYDNNGETDSGISPSGIDSKPTAAISEPFTKSSSLTTIVASIVSVVIILIVIGVVVILVFRKRRNETKEPKPDLRPTGNANPTCSTTKSNEYIEFDDSIPVQALKPTYVEIPVDGHSNKPFVDGTSEHLCGVKTYGVYIKEKSIGGYLAPDYGILMGGVNKENGLEIKHHIPKEPVYTEVKKKICKMKTGEHNDTFGEDTFGEDLQNYDNNGSDSENELVFNAKNKSQEEQNKVSNECDCYNVKRNDDGDEDLELFENTVYNQT